ncbi:CidA/LrgA family protein [Lactococcus protaetiae]|uniref:CidA/LrgA family protein n=1 Tax=Lactococcus protaetiae TaxID=2592653 RepID=A0A514Z8I4_9LACT|nr:CidA/LrgA family protein [Lactococcus protaetiae]QDK70891.1 CidA/LrgA family protein [Lactococcus protaetiae]
MKIYLQLLIIFGFSFIGNIISNGLHLPIPGSILGMVLLFLALQFKILEFKHVDEAGSFLINNMTILFLPAGVGIMAKWNLISHFWVQILIIILGALIINVFVLGKLVEWIKIKFEGDYVIPELSSQQIALDVINQHSKNKTTESEGV